MKKLESSLMNMVLVLTGVTVIAGALLGYVNELTKGPIAEANAKALSDAIALVVPGFDNNPAEAPESIELKGATYKIYKPTNTFRAPPKPLADDSTAAPMNSPPLVAL